MQEAPAPTARLKIEFAQASDPGRDPNKQINEDSCGYAETRFGYLCVLCDGMGGHYGGREASQTAIRTIFELFEQLPPSTSPAAALKTSIEEAARRVYQLGGPPENRARPGSTVVAMLLHDRGLDVAHVGDSRAYVIRANQIYPLTRDHSMVQGMIDAGMLTEEQAIGHPDANKITRALGMRPEVEVELRPEPMELFKGDVLLQSSDGLTDLALGADILGATRQALASGDVSYACNMLVKLANDRGGHDNITVQMVRVVEVGQRALTTIPGTPASPSIARAAQSGPLETVQMTAPDTVPPQSAVPQQQPPPALPPPALPPPAAPAGQAVLSPTAPGSASWAPVQAPAPAPQAAPTATDAPPPATLPSPALPPPAAPPGVSRSTPPMAPTPTVPEVAPLSQPWPQGMYAPQQQPAAAAPARPNGPAPYPLDNSPAALPLPPPSAARRITAPGTMPAPIAPGAGPYSMSPSSTTPGAVPAKGGIVFVIIGMSAVIAVLLLLLIWALWLR